MPNTPDPIDRRAVDSIINDMLAAHHDNYLVALAARIVALPACLVAVAPEAPQPVLDVAAIIEKAREYANDMDEYSRWGSCFTDCANALTTLAARLAEVERERDEWKSYKDRVEVSERERDTDRARLHASDDLAVKNAIERDAYKESVQGAGVVIHRIKAERDAALTRAAAAEKALAEDSHEEYRKVREALGLGVYEGGTVVDAVKALKAEVAELGEVEYIESIDGDSWRFRDDDGHYCSWPVLGVRCVLPGEKA